MAVQVLPDAGMTLSIDTRVPASPTVVVPTKRVAILGLGYVGLPTALSLVDAGLAVTGIDVSAKRIAAIRARQVDVSPLDRRRLGGALRGGRLRLTRRGPDLADSDTVIIAVPTPVDEHLVPDLSMLEAACATAVASARPGQTFILTSTSYVGCTRDLLVEPLERRGFHVGQDIFVAFSPERIDPGNTLYPQERVPRVIGGVTEECVQRAADIIGLVAPFTRHVTSPEVAEMTKLHENIFRAVNIALVNEMADIAGHLGIDINEVVEAAATKPYGFMPFAPGPGVGGHCIPCDPHYLLWQLRGERVDAPIVERAMTSIAARPNQIVLRARQALAELCVPITKARVLVLGVAYKPGVEDVRESPALEVMERLVEAGAEVAFSDPLVSRVCINGREHDAVSSPALGSWDLVIAHTVAPDEAVDWLMSVPAVLDASFRLPASIRALRP